MQTSRRHRRKWDDPLVPIHSDRLRAAMGLGGWTVTRLAKRLGKGENPQTLHHLQQGAGPKRCRASRRAGLAQALDVPEEWLGGSAYALPLPGSLPLIGELEGSPRLILAAGRLLWRCHAAVERDLDQERARPDPPVGFNPRYEVLWFMASAIGHMVSPERWRHQLVRLADGPPGRSTSAVLVPDIERWMRPLEPVMWTRPVEGRVLDPRHEAAALGLVQAWTVILGSWLDGGAVFDYGAFFDLAGALNPIVRQMYPQSWHNRESARVLPPASPTSPYALVDWPLDATLRKSTRADGKKGRRRMR